MAKRAERPTRRGIHHSLASLRKQWEALHAGDREPWPTSPEAQNAWLLVHNGAFEAAMATGAQADGSGINAANKAACVYASHLETDAGRQQRLLLDAAARALALQQAEPLCANAWYWYAVALGRYSQTISVAKSLAEGLGTRVRKALDQTLKLEPAHADAHIAMAAFHAEVIDKVGVLIGGMTYGAQVSVGVSHYQTALALNPHSAFAKLEAANGLLMLQGASRRAQAHDLLLQAAQLRARDVVEQLEVTQAQRELESWPFTNGPAN
jgi:hypothetical protein